MSVRMSNDISVSQENKQLDSEQQQAIKHGSMIFHVMMESGQHPPNHVPRPSEPKTYFPSIGLALSKSFLPRMFRR